MMIKYLIVAVMLCFCLGLSAQTLGGIKGGLNINDMIITSTQLQQGGETSRTLYSFHVGSHLQHTFNNHFGWRIEMLFSNKGFYSVMGDEKIKTSLNYINWPVLLVYATNIHLDLEAGVELGYLVSGEKRFSAFDMGIDIGARYDLTDKFNIGLRYNLGFPFQFRAEQLDFSNAQSSYQHSVLQFSVGYNLIHALGAGK